MLDYIYDQAKQLIESVREETHALHPIAVVELPEAGTQKDSIRAKRGCAATPRLRISARHRAARARTAQRDSAFSSSETPKTSLSSR